MYVPEHIIIIIIIITFLPAYIISSNYLYMRPSYYTC